MPATVVKSTAVVREVATVLMKENLAAEAPSKKNGVWLLTFKLVERNMEERSWNYLNTPATIVLWFSSSYEWFRKTCFCLRSEDENKQDFVVLFWFWGLIEKPLILYYCFVSLSLPLWREIDNKDRGVRCKWKNLFPLYVCWGEIV